MSSPPVPPAQDELTFTPVGGGFQVRRRGVFPALAQLSPTPDGWAVSLLAVSFDAAPQVVATGIATVEDASRAAAVALATVGVLDRQEAYRFRYHADGPNRWYVDRTARLAAPFDGRLPDLAGADADVRERLPAIQGYLDATFPDLVNLAQHRPHFDPARGRTTDPNEHTVEVLARLDTRDLTPREALLARVATLYHDVGKGRDAYTPEHPLESARLAAPHLAAHGLTRGEAERVLLQVREHDLLGVVSRVRISVDTARRRLGLAAEPRNLPMHHAIASADVGAIRGLRWVVERGLLVRAREAIERGDPGGLPPRP